MPQFEFEVTPVTAVTWVFASRTVEKGRLKSLSVVPILGTIYYGTAFIVIGTTIASVVDDRPSAIFFSGYVSRSSQFIWSGDYPFSPYEIVFAKARALYQVTLRIVGVTEMINP